MEEENSPRVVVLDHHDLRVAALLVALQRASYRVEAERIGDDAIPPLHEDADAVAALDLTFLAIERDGGPVAALGYRVADGVLDIDRLAIHPHHFREGLGRRLVSAVLLRVPHERAVVSTGRANRPARRLYEGVGFMHRADVAITPTLIVAQYERVAPEAPATAAGQQVDGTSR
jgi:GNAT superfamily N-acetyltransferase